MQEEWKPVNGFEGIYEVSNYGGVKRISTRTGVRQGTVLKTSKNHKGYQIVGLCWNRKQVSRTVHRVVCEAFIDPRPKGYTINH